MAAAAALPTEIITDILSRLPVKTLVRFKCVCKSWYALLKNPNFVNLHLNRSLKTNTNRYIIVWFDTSLFSAELDHPHFHFSELNHPLKTSTTSRKTPSSPLTAFFSSGIQLLGSCNGVLCITDSTRDDVVLYNPLTNTHRKLPQSYIKSRDDMLVFGFGYDSANDDYKVLRIVQCRVNTISNNVDDAFYNESKLYSLKSNSWKRVGDIPFFVLYKDHHGTLVNEALHYIVTKKELDVKYRFIACFHLCSETYSLVDHPDYDEERSSSLYLSELGGCLCLLVNYHDPLSCADLWVMKEYGKKESWARLFSVRHSVSLGKFYLIRPVAYSKDGGKVLLEQDNEKLRWYDLKSNRAAKSVRIHGLPQECFDSGVFLGSLVSLAEDKPKSEGPKMPGKNKKRNDVDKFLSVGFKLRL